MRHRDGDIFPVNRQRAGHARKQYSAPLTKTANTKKPAQLATHASRTFTYFSAEARATVNLLIA